MFVIILLVFALHLLQNWIFDICNPTIKKSTERLTVKFKCEKRNL